MAVHLLFKNGVVDQVYLVLPYEGDLQYGFAGLSESGLKEALLHQIHLDHPTLCCGSAYYGKPTPLKIVADMQALSEELALDYPFIQTAVQAHLDRIPSGGEPGRPQRVLKNLKKELATEDFGTVFAEFGKREAIYGFGDLQVKRIWDKL